MDINRLPTELLESILFYLDGPSLARSQCVCKLWQSCVDNLAKVRYVWFEKCTQDILPGTVKLLLGCDPCKLDGTWNQWKAVYQRWYRSRFVKSWRMQTVWQRSHWAQDIGSDRTWQSPQLQICGDEVVLLEWTHMARWSTSGDELPVRDLINPNNTKKLVTLVNPITSQEADSQRTKSSGITYPCQILSVGNILFLLTNSRTRSFQLPNEVNCMDIWNNDLVIGWVNTGKIDLYTLPDDLLTCTELDLLRTSYNLHQPPEVDVFDPEPDYDVFEYTGDSTIAIVGNRAFLVSGEVISVFDLEKKLRLASTHHEAPFAMHMVTNGKMVFCVVHDVAHCMFLRTKRLQVGALIWFEWDEETHQLLQGKTCGSIPQNIVCVALSGDLLALGTSDGFIYMYTLNRNSSQEKHKNCAQEKHKPEVDSSDSSSDEGSCCDDFYEGLPDHEKTETMIYVERALGDPHTICMPGCDTVEGIAISDDGSGPVVAAVGTKADEKWKRIVHLFKWSNG